MSWWFSSILLLPLVLIGVMQLSAASDESRTVSWTVADASGPVAGVRVSAGAIVATTDVNGSVALDADQVGTAPVVFDREEFYSVRSTVPAVGDAPIAVSLRSSGVTGLVTDGGSGQPIDGASVSVAGTDQTVLTGADGRYELTGLPEGASLTFTADGYSPVEDQVADRTAVDAALAFTRVTGLVLDGAGEPIGNARVQGDEVSAVTRADGTFDLDDAGSVSELRVSASGFDDVTVPVDATRSVNARLERVTIRASYINQFGLADPETLDQMIETVNGTELNAIVLDIKQDTIYYETRVSFFSDVPDMIVPLYDPVAIVQRLHDEGIYAIARLVVFQDPLVAEHYPEYAVRNENTGESWRDPNGVAWVNAFYEPLWDANIELALEAVEMGFDEIQYDYVRFPSDGDLTVADFGPDYSQEAREGAITGFVERSAEAIRPTGAKLALDLFGIIGLFDNDQGIGQRLSQLAPLVDYVCLMIYPSHFDDDGIIRSAPGHPNDYPGETITESLERAAEIVPDSVDKFRPWLQDFTQPLEGFTAYGPAEVREQIDAAEAFGGNGWLLWNPNNEPSVDALLPED